MRELIFFGCLSFILLSALALLVYPLRHHKKILLLIVPTFVSISVAAYLYWGGFFEWRAFHQAQIQKQQVQAMLKKLKSPNVIIEQLKSRLQQDPNSAKGWYLLGRLYASQGNWQQAEQVFFKAKTLDARDIVYQINYIEALWQMREQRFDTEIHGLLLDVLRQEPHQADALSMLALEAFQDKNYSKAIDYWQQMLKMLPANSPEANTIAKAIARAHQLSLKQ